MVNTAPSGTPRKQRPLKQRKEIRIPSTTERWLRATVADGFRGSDDVKQREFKLNGDNYRATLRQVDPGHISLNIASDCGNYAATRFIGDPRAKEVRNDQLSRKLAEHLQVPIELLLQQQRTTQGENQY